MKHPKNTRLLFGIPEENSILNNCIHCGLCLQVCPTYVITGLERSSPRGRIRMIKEVTTGGLPLSKEFIFEMDYCLACRACETACPAGIRFGVVIENVREQLNCVHDKGFIRYYSKHFLLRWIFMRQNRLKRIAKILKSFQKELAHSFITEYKWLKLFPDKIIKIISLTPDISAIFSSDILSEIIKPKRHIRFRTLFLTGCIMDVAFAQVNEDTVNLLLHHGCEVIIPKEQYCCGSLMKHNGDKVGAKILAEKNIEAFLKYDFDYIITNSAGCGAFMKEYGSLFVGNTLITKKATSVSKRVRDITEFLAETGFFPNLDEKVNQFYGKKVAYHDACHLIHGQHISDQPRKLFRAVRGIEFIDLHDSALCCGSAGIYNVLHYEDSMKILDRKIMDIKAAKPDVLITGNPGCLIQIQHGLMRAGLNIQLFHTATFLRRVCCV